MSYSMLDYWPPFLQGQPGEKTFHYPYVDASATAFSWQFFWDAKTSSMIARQTNADGSWNSDWFLQWRSNGLVEWRDDTPATGLARLLGPKQTVTTNPPIWWGKDLNIGTPVAASCKQTGLFGQWGYQVVGAEAHYDTWNGFSDVLQIISQQEWNGGQFVGWRGWFAKGIGPVGHQWASVPNNVFGSVQIAQVGMV
jgi:hypothetical protein